MSTEDDDTDKGICILSLDSGGSGTYAQLLLIKRYMTQLATSLDRNGNNLYPADYFDLVGGAGFGGLVALMIGYLRMTVNEATDKLLAIGNAVFPHEPNMTRGPETNTQRLKIAIEDLLRSKGVSLDTKLHDKGRPSTNCRVAIYATTSADLSQPKVFRTYSRRGSSLNPTIVEAICATMAMPSLFSPVKIGPHLREQTFVGAPLGANNPTRELLKEAGVIFGDDKRVAQIISLGAGRSGAVSLDSFNSGGMADGLLKAVRQDCEMVALELSGRFFNVEAYVRFNVNCGMERALDDWGGLDEIETKTNAFVETLAVARLLEGSVQYLQSRVGTATLGQINQSSGTRVAVKAVPAVSPYYVARKKEFSSMIHHLIELPSSNQKIFAITGMGGCGKTQMVSYFLQERGSEYTDVVYVDAGSSSSLKADLQAWARSLGLGHEHEVWEDAIRMLSGGLHEGRWMLVLDNADNPAFDLVPFIPKCYHGTVVITSRNRDVGNLSNTHHLELGEMETNEATSALLRAARRESVLSLEETTAAHELVKLLGCLAVALVQAGAYCHQLSSSEPFTFTQYISIFLAQRSELMKRAGPASLDNYRLGAYTAFDLSYKAIPGVAKELLHFAASFHHSDISLAMLDVAAGLHFTDSDPALLPRPQDHSSIITGLQGLLCPDGKWNEIQMHSTIRTLRSFSLVTASSMMNMVFLHLHPLVQAWARDILPSKFQTSRRMAVQVITTCQKQDDFQLHRHLVPHIRDLIEVYTSDTAHVNDQFAAADILANQSIFDDAERLCTIAVEVLRSLEGHDSVAGLKVAALLAMTYKLRGKWSEAERLQLELLERRQRLLGDDHLDTIAIKENLASTYSAQGRYKEAEELDLEALECRKRVMEGEHPEIARTTSNLVIAYMNQGRYDEAERLQLQALEQWKRLRGKDDSSTIRELGVLGSIYGDQGRHSEAEKLLLEVVAQLKKLMGQDHLHTIHAVRNLAVTYVAQGRHDDAEELMADVVQRSKRLLGKDHMDTIDATRVLVGIYSSQGRKNEADQVTMELLEQRRRLQKEAASTSVDVAANVAAIYSPRNDRGDMNEIELKALAALEKLEYSKKAYPPEIRASMELAATHTSQSQFKEAEKIQVEILERQRSVLGSDDLASITAMDELAGTYVSLGQRKDSEVLEEEGLKRRRRVQGIDHPDTLLAMSHLASSLSAQGKLEEAEKLLLDLLERRKRLNGEDDPLTIRTTWNLAVGYNTQKRYQEAEELMLQVVEQRRKVLGSEHLDTIFAVENLARSYDHQKRWSDAEKLDLEVLELRRRVQGNDHADTIRAASNLASTYQSLGQNGEAEELLSVIIEQRRRLLGKDHPNTILSMVKLAVGYMKSQQLAKSEALFTEIVTSSLVTFGKEHTRTQFNIAALIFILKMAGKLEEAEEMKKELIVEVPQ